MVRYFPALFWRIHRIHKGSEVLVVILLARARVLMLKELRREPGSNLQEKIVQLVGQGYRTREIAEILSLREEALSAHLFSIFRTLGVSDLLELTVYAMIHRLSALAGGSIPRPQTHGFEQPMFRQARPAV